MPSYKNSMMSQIVIWTCSAIVLMQLYQFYLNQEILTIFELLFNWTVLLYVKSNAGSNQVPDKKLNEPESEKVDEAKPSLHDINDIQDVW